MHPLKIYLCYALIGLALGWHFSRCRGSGVFLKAGDSFRLSTPFLVLAAMCFLGLPAGLVFSLPEAAHPLAATVATILVSTFFAILFAAVVSTRLQLTDTGLTLGVLGITSRAHFSAFQAIEMRRYNLVLIPKNASDRPFVVPAFFQESGRIFDHVRSQIEAESDTRELPSSLTSPST
jgi:hypothetical protein